MPSYGNLDFNDEMGGIGLGNLQSKALNNQASFNLENAGGTDGLGGNIWGKGGMASMALGGLKTVGSIWSAFQQFKLAKDTLKFQKNAFKVNLENSQQVYNTALEDRIRARYITEGRPEEADAKIKENRLG